MEFKFDIGHIFKQEISVIGEDMLPEGGIPATSPGKSLGLAQQRIMEILDRMGEASARAQEQKEFPPSYVHVLYQNVEVQLAPQLKIRISSLADHIVTHFQMHLSADSN